jgi:hypothetical protein
MSDLAKTPSPPDTAASKAERPRDHDKPTQSLSLLSLTPADLARLLTRVGGQPVRGEAIQADRAAGAPANADGTINLVHYAAWLVREEARRD